MPPASSPLPQSASGSLLGAGTMPSAVLRTMPSMASSLTSSLPTTMRKTSGMSKSSWGCNALFGCDHKCQPCLATVPAPLPSPPPHRPTLCPKSPPILAHKGGRPRTPQA